jgi:hypothetical protein
MTMLDNRPYFYVKISYIIILLDIKVCKYFGSRINIKVAEICQKLLDVRGSVHHSTIQKEKSNKTQKRIKILLFHIYMKLNMFRAAHCPLSGA